jgi:acyl carrier protein phosphodiesterase
MNFLAHLLLAGDDDGLRLGAILGDFVRGRHALAFYPGDVRLGIELHRHTDQFFDSLPDVANLRKHFPAPFRRYSAIVLSILIRKLKNYWQEMMHCCLTACASS